MAKLREYERKRDFKATPEPAGKKRGAKGKEPRFVVQEHSATRLHWDLRLEHEGVLASWAIPNGIPLDPDENRKAVHTEDHPLEYIDFHGEIPEGNYGAGTMTIFDSGTYELHKWEDRKVVFSFNGEKLSGRYALFQTGSDGKDWMIHRMDPAEPGREPMPEQLVPMLAKLSKLPPDDENWAYEVKWDGIRAVAYLQPGRLRLESRRLNDLTSQYPELRALTRAVGGHDAVFDGEIVAFDPDGKPSFERLQQRMHQTSEAVIRRRMKSHPATYVIFDLLHLDGRSLMGEPYTERRRLLEELGLNGDHWQTPAYSAGGGAKLLKATAAQGLEGLVAKRLDSTYDPGKRGGAWLKVKNTARQELVIGGWLPGEGRRKDQLGALLVGFQEPGADGKRQLRYAGRVGTGFKEKDLRELMERLKPLERETSPFAAGKPPKGAVFVKPELVAEVEFTEWTAEKMLRHPSFKGLREDKAAVEVVLEGVDTPGDEPPALDIPETGRTATLEVDGRRLRLTNLGKELYPKTGFTKARALDYYARAAPVLLPHLHGRGVADDLASLLEAVNGGGHELALPLAREGGEGSPDFLLFDLAPGKGAGMPDCCQVALWIRGMLDQLGLPTYPRTSGAGGLHVYVPLNSEQEHQAAAVFAGAVARTLAKQFPDRVAAGSTRRAGKVLVDVRGNDADARVPAPYSLRAGKGLAVSTPVSWHEVEEALESPDDAALEFDPPAILERIEAQGDLFAPVLTERNELPAL